MKITITLLIVLFVSGCAGTATVVSCAANLDQVPKKNTYHLAFKASLRSDGQEHNAVAKMVCRFKERTCGGGDWYFKWDRLSGQDITFQLSDNKQVNIELPNCTMALRAIDEAGTTVDAHYPYGYAVIVSNGQEFRVSNSDLSKAEADNVYGFSLTELSISEIVVD